MIKKLFLVSFILISVNVLAQSPILNNFRIENSHKNRVYFDSSEPIIASNFTGFTISGKTISGIFVNSGETLGHYFTVSSQFSFWDNNTIRYEGGSDMADLNSNSVHNFTLSYIENNIPEPDALSYRYVTTNASGGGDGLTEDTAWTLSEAFSKAVAGETVWIKAGNYGDKNFQIDLDGTPTNPIKLIGYKNTIGDITDNYWDYGVPFSSDEMPTLTGTFSDANYGRAIFWIESNYVIFRNFQVTKYLTGMSSGPNAYQANSNLIFDKVNGYDFNKPNVWDTYSSAFTFDSDLVGNTNIRFLNGVIMNYEMHGLQLYGDGQCLIDNMKIYNTDNSVKPDYQINVNGHHNIIRNCHIEIKGDYYSASTHGIGIRGGDKLSNTYNLIEKSKAININEGFYVRNMGCDYNIIKDSYVGNNGATSNYRGGVYIWGGADHNIVERLIVEDVTVGIGFKDNKEEDNVAYEDYEIGRNNIIRNCTFNGFDTAVGIEEQTSGGNGKLYDTKIINCTFNDGEYLFRYDTNLDVRNLEFINTSFSNINNYSRGVSEGESFSYSNFWNYWGVNGTAPSGTGNSSLEPLFLNPSVGDFHLQPTSPIKDSGINDNNVNFDIEGIERVDGKYSIGAYDDAVPSIGTVSPDVSICSGENTILIASGGTNYLWNTGDTTASISVNPLITTTYTVTVSNGNGSNDHEVTVTVNQAPSVNAGSDQTICAGEDITLTASGVGNFLWSTGETTSSITVSPATTTTYTVTSSNSCSDDVIDQVIVNVTPSVNLTLGSDVDICLGESVTLTAQSNGDFLWNTGETTASITVNPTTTTIYSITSSLGNCFKSEEVTVTVSQAPSVNAGSDQTICAGEDITLTASGVGNFLWSTGETTSSITVSPTSTTTYTVTASNSCTDDATDQVTVNVTPGVNLTLGSDVDICLGESVTLTAQSNGDFLWNTGETTASITVSPTTTTIYSITSSLGNCSKSEEVTVTVNQAPSVNAGSDQTICAGEDITLTASGVGNFLWSTGETTSSITVSPTTTTTYTVTASNSCSNDVTDQIIVSVNDKPTLSVSNDITIENGSSTVLTASGDGNFLWSTGETTSSITVSPSITTTYSVTLTSQQGCSETNSIEVTVTNSSETTVSADAGPDQDVCLDASVELTASGGDSYLWSTGETTPSITVSPTDTTTYTVTVSNGNSIDVDDITVYVDKSCSDIANRPIIQEFKVYPNPTNGILHIELSGYSNELNLSLYNSTGKIIHSDIISNYSLDKSLKRNINLRKYGKGVYYARIVNNGKNETKKVIVM